MLYYNHREHKEPYTHKQQNTRKVKKVKIMLVIEALKAAKKSGCKVYKVNGHDTFGFIITPNNNILAVNKSMWGSGVTFTLEYTPSSKNGSGCACMDGYEHDFGINEINAEIIAHYENEGLKFARKLKANLYNNPLAWLDRERVFWKNDIVEF